MKLIKLKIENFRGIRVLDLEPNGNNLVISGPNGSGKSAVIDAVDFLLTGQILRLTGEGTGNITLKKHGPHVDCNPKDAKVSAAIYLPEIQKVVEVERCIANSQLKFDTDPKTERYLEQLIRLAQQGSIILSRRQIHKYITSTPNLRAQKIYDLLNVTSIESIRKNLVTTKNQYENRLQTAQRDLKRVQTLIQSITQQSSFREENVLQFVNRNRAILGGQPISELHSSNLTEGCLHGSVFFSTERSLEITEDDISNLLRLLSRAKTIQRRKLNTNLYKLVSSLVNIPDLEIKLNKRQLIELGVTLIDKSGKCPLCDTSWPSGRLHDYLSQQLSSSNRLKRDLDRQRG